MKIEFPWGSPENFEDNLVTRPESGQFSPGLPQLESNGPTLLLSPELCGYHTHSNISKSLEYNTVVWKLKITIIFLLWAVSNHTSRL